jgi:transmembrane sensor
LTTAFSDETLREASDWYARLHSGDATAQDHVRLGDWLATQPENQQAYEFVTETGRLAAHVHPASNGRRKPAPARRSSLRGTGAGASAARRRWAQAAGAAAAAAIVAGIGIAIVTQPHEENYQTAVGEIRNVTLADGSTLALNGATRLTVKFTRDARELDIATGEFFVTVGKDPARPFRVHAKGRVIEDIGTAFDVDTNGNQVDVAVGEGTVMISNLLGGGAAAGPAIVLNKGEALTYSADQIIETPRLLAAPDVGTWRIGILSYDRSRLEWLVADLNRRFDRTITVPDAALAAMPITLTLKLHDRDTTIGTLEKLLPVRAVTQADGSTELVSPKP